MRSTRWATSCARAKRCATADVPFVPGGLEAIADVAARASRRRTVTGSRSRSKPPRGGGGKGLQGRAPTPNEIESAFETARREARAYFKDDTIYAERYLENPKHVELQMLADKHGNVVHVGERDCSLQRRHQKLWEETPAQISERVRAAMREAGMRAAKAIGYDSVGTIECLVAGDEFYFLEMNTRIQVEHTVSEMISGLDLVREQIRVAAGEAARLYARAISASAASRSRCASMPRIPRRTSGPPGNDQRVSRAGRPRRSRRLGGLRRLDDPARLRFADRQAHRLGADARRSDRAPAPRDRRVRHRRRADDAAAAARALRRSRRDRRVVRHGDARTIRARPSSPPRATVGSCPPRRRASRNAGSRRDWERCANARAASSGNDVRSPMHGLVVELRVAHGRRRGRRPGRRGHRGDEDDERDPRPSRRSRHCGARERRCDRRERLGARTLAQA